MLTVQDNDTTLNFVLALRIWQRCQQEAAWWRLRGLLQYAQEAERAGRIWRSNN